MKIILRLLILLVVLLALGFVGVTAFAPGIAKSAIEDSGQQALGVSTAVEEVGLGLFSGEFGLSGLTIANPAGFSTDHGVLKIGSVDLNLSPRELLGDPVHIKKLHLKDVAFRLEAGTGGSNVGKLIDHATQPGADKKPKASEGEGKRFVIDELVIDGLSVSAALLGAADLDAKLAPIRLENIGTAGNKGVLLGELATGVLDALLASTVQADIGLPTELLKSLEGSLGQLQGLGIEGLESIQQQGASALSDLKQKLGGLLGSGAGAGAGVLDGLEKKGGDALKKGTDELKKKLPKIPGLGGGN